LGYFQTIILFQLIRFKPVYFKSNQHKWVHKMVSTSLLAFPFFCPRIYCQPAMFSPILYLLFFICCMASFLFMWTQNILSLTHLLHSTLSSPHTWYIYTTCYPTLQQLLNLYLSYFPIFVFTHSLLWHPHQYIFFGPCHNMPKPSSSKLIRRGPDQHIKHCIIFP
jgi:hypothetical protein